LLHEIPAVQKTLLTQCCSDDQVGAFGKMDAEETGLEAWTRLNWLGIGTSGGPLY